MSHIADIQFPGVPSDPMRDAAQVCLAALHIQMGVRQKQKTRPLRGCPRDGSWSGKRRCSRNGRRTRFQDRSSRPRRFPHHHSYLAVCDSPVSLASQPARRVRLVGRRCQTTTASRPWKAVARALTAVAKWSDAPAPKSPRDQPPAALQLAVQASVAGQRDSVGHPERYVLCSRKSPSSPAGRTSSACGWPLACGPALPRVAGMTRFPVKLFAR